VSGVAHGQDFSPLYWMPEMTPDRMPMPPGHGAGSPPPVGDEMLMVCCGKTGTAMARYDATLGIWTNDSGFEIPKVRFWKTLAEYQSDFAAQAESAPLPVTPVEPPLDDDASGGAGGLVRRVFTWVNQRVRLAFARRRSRAWADPKTVNG